MEIDNFAYVFKVSIYRDDLDPNNSHLSCFNL